MRLRFGSSFKNNASGSSINRRIVFALAVPARPLTRAVSEAVGIPVIASGGAGELQHLADVLREGLADAVLAASIFHFGKHTVAEAKEHLASQGLPVRKRFDD